MSKCNISNKYIFENKNDSTIELTLIELYNIYLTIYNKIKDKNNCLLINYEEIINLDFYRLFNFLKIEYSNDNLSKIIKFIQHKQKTHGSSRNIYEAIDYYVNFEVYDFYTPFQIMYINNNTKKINNKNFKKIMEFDYIIEKIKNAEIINHPFPHLDIKNFLSK